MESSVFRKENQWFALRTAEHTSPKSATWAGIGGSLALQVGVKSDYFDANYNLGALYFNKAVLGINEANEMWKPRMTKAESAEQKALENAAKDKFIEALPSYSTQPSSP